LAHLVTPKISCVESKDNFGQFLAEPVDKGFGVTLGNSLRRVLLGHIPGAAVTRLRIEGIQHEFSPIPHVKEDTMDFLLNVKQLRLKPVSGEQGKLELEVEKEGRIYAADIKPQTDFEIVNPELYLATLDSSEGRLYVEFDVEIAVGYGEAQPSDELPIGTIPIDPIFTPVRRVNFAVEPTHIGRETSYERLRLDIWTDGTITPANALSCGAGILTEVLSPFVEYTRVSLEEEKERLVRESIPGEKYNMAVEQLDLSMRTMNCLRRAGISTVGEVIMKGKKGLSDWRNFGEKSPREIEDRLGAMGLSLSSQVDGDAEDES